MAPDKNHRNAKRDSASSNKDLRILWVYLESVGSSPTTRIIGCFIFEILFELRRFIIAAPLMGRTLIRAD
jgi:hypothetical protein